MSGLSYSVTVQEPGNEQWEFRDRRGVVVAQYRTTTSFNDGVRVRRYAKRIGDDWVDITDDEAKAAGVWKDPRGGQFGVKDHLATPEQLAARDKGRYDPRPASGDYVAVRVSLVCGKCGAKLGEVAEYEKRDLYKSLRTGRWTREPADLKCHDCFGPLDMFGIDKDAIAREVELAKKSSRAKPRMLRIGRMPKRLDLP